MKKVLIAGASGYLGRHLVGELSSRGHWTRALIRDPAKAELVAAAQETVVCDLRRPGQDLDRALEGIEIVFSAAGQPCTLQAIGDRSSFRAVDYPINRALLDAALAAGVERFGYVTVLAPETMGGDAYVGAHEEFVKDLEAASIEHTVVRANGFFYSYIDLLDVARRGLAVSIGKDEARSNPIHEADLASACADAIEGSVREVEVGGPEVITRREEIEIAFAALGRKPRILHVPRPLLGTAARLMGIRDKRRAEMLRFLATLSSADVLGPPYGERRLRDYLGEHV